MEKTIPVTIGKGAAYYEKEGLKEGVVQSWEDGMRTSGTDDAFEWWYFDAHLEGGAMLVIGFYTKPVFDQSNTLKPYVSINFDTPDGVRIAKRCTVSPEGFRAGKESCNVTIGNNTFAGDLHHYTIHAEFDGIAADVDLEGSIPAWRAETGFVYYGEREEEFFAWLAAVPQGAVKASVTIAGKATEYTGYGYHDHNWGNAPMMKLMHHWYWGRAKVGDYTILSAFIVTEKQYGYQKILKFMLAKDGKILADNTGGHVRFSAGDQALDAKTQKPADHSIAYCYDDGVRRFTVSFRVKDTIVSAKMIDTLPPDKRKRAEQIGFDGAYLRFKGDAAVEQYDKDTLIDSVTDTALWELMYFGESILETGN